MIKTLLRGLVACGLLLSANGMAATYTFNTSGSTLVSGTPSICSGSWSRNATGNVFTCSEAISTASGDVLTVSSATPVTLVATTTLSLTGTAAGSSTAPISLQTSYGAISLSSSTVSGSVRGDSDITSTSTAVTGNLTGDYGAINLNSGSVGGNVSNSGSINTNGTNVGGTLTSSNGSISLTGGTIVGLVQSNCCTVTSNNSNLQNGARANSSSLSITGGTLAGDFYAGNNPATFTNVTMTSGTVTGATTITVTDSQMGSSGSSVTMTSNSGAITLNNSTVYGTLTAPNYSTVNVNSPSTVYGTCLPNSTPANACSSFGPLLSWSLDQESWTGAAGEVKDGSGNGLDGTVFNAAQTAKVAPALPEVNAEGTCRYGSFTSGNQQYVQHPHDNRLNLQGSFSVGLWVKPRVLPASGLMTILSKDENYEFHINPDGTIYWWWQTTGGGINNFSSSSPLPAGQWSHVLIRYAPGDQRIYINGALAGQANLAGTPVANTDPLQLGNDQNYGGRFFDGQLDELRIYTSALSTSQISALVSERHSCALSLQCFNDNFSQASLSSDWAVTTSGGSFGLPVIVANRLRLTNSAGNVATAATLQRLFPAASNYVQVQFKHYAYNGSGADGIGVILSDASITPQAGSYGGPLGYGSRGNATNPGFAGGWLGVGIDEYGNFSTEGGPDGPGRRIDSVAMRGSGATNRINGYAYIAGTAANLNPGVDIAGATPGPGHTYRVTVDGRYTGKALVTVERDSGAGFAPLPGLNGIDVLTSAGQAALPQNFYLSFTGSSGGSTNTHELDDVQVCASEMNPIGLQIDHYEFVHAGNALTCNPLDVLIRACLDAACSSTYNDSITATFNPTGWVGGNTVTFSGGSINRQLRVNTASSVTLGVANSNPPLKALSQSRCSSGGGLSTNCAVSFADSGFIFDVPNTLSAKPTNATIQAVKKSDSSQACVPGFASGTRTLQFTSSYTNPATGTLPVQVNGTAVTASPANVSLNFDATASAPLSVQYNDAGLMTLNASYTGSASSIEAGLVMTGSDQFVAKPYGLCLRTDTSASCTSADINCPAFPGSIRAGDSFPLRIQAVGWQADGEALTASALCTGNPITPNFQLNNIALSSQLLAPAGGSSGSLGLSSYGHVPGNQTTVSQSISEVGVFSLTASPAANSYLGESVSASVSGYVGRMIPKYLGASGSASLTPACGSAFSYQGQPIGFAAGQEPRLTLTGYNAQGGVTTNYDRGSFWRLSTPGRSSYQSVTGLPSMDAVGRLQLSGTASAIQSGADNGDGARAYTWSGETLSYSAALLPSTEDLPFTAAIRQPFTAAALTDSDGACLQNGQPSCQPFSFDFLNSPGTQVRLGRLRLGNAHGSELQGLSLPLWLESWQSIGTPTAPAGAFRTEPADTCSGPLLGAPLLSQFSGNLQAGEVAASLLGPLAGSGSIQLSAPGAGNDGSVQASLPGLNWLWYDWNGSGRQAAQGLSTFGVYQGSTPLIFRRELYR